MNRLDLSKEVTVFVISVNTPDLPVCLDALDRQDSTFQRVLIENVAPMNAAFQQMIDRCKTPYFVQVDEDMILYPNAIRRLYEHLSSSHENCAMFFLSLRDTDLNYPIVGVKIYRHGIYQRFPFQDSFSCETNQNARLKAANYFYDGIWHDYMGDHVVGEHGHFWTPLSLFERYYRMAQKMRLNPKEMGSWGAWVQRFAARFGKHSTQRHLFALLGWTTGLTSDLAKCQGEKDFRTYSEIPEWKELSKHLALPDGPMAPVLEVPFAIPPGPTELNVYLTTRCNFSCPWCRRQQEGQQIEEAPDVRPDLIQSLMGKWPTLKSCCIAGFGEPLLSEQLVPVVNKAKARGLYTSLITNGALVLDRADDLRTLPLDAISISLNAATAEEHERKTGTRTWETVIQGIHWLRYIGRDPVLSFVITRQDLPKIPAYLELAKDLACRVDLLSVLPHHANPKDEAFWKIALATDYPEVVPWIEHAKKHPEAARVRTWPTLIRKEGGRCPGACNSPFVSLGVDGNESITGCRRITPPCHALGKWYDPGALQSDAIAEMQRKFKNKDWPDLCRRCFGNWQVPEGAQP